MISHYCSLLRSKVIKYNPFDFVILAKDTTVCLDG